MTAILYEHPLNERIRHYLKLEQLFAQATDCLHYNFVTSHCVFFNALFTILDTLERNDIRGDLIKDLEKLAQNLVIWSQNPDIDNAALENNLQKTVELSRKLKVHNAQWLQLKADKFLTGLKQRFAIQGGSSRFDLPQLQFWLNQPSTEVKAQCHHWLSLLEQINTALSLNLMFLRQRAAFEEITTESGFYQDNGEGLILIRIKLADNLPFYPTISGNRFRYSIRFMMPCNEAGRKYSKQATKFQLARC
ncbi:MAG: cell division protein ZapD [Psychroserpens sp.]|jgi:cell division protein ZapD